MFCFPQAKIVSTEFTHYLNELNLKRTRLVSVIILLFQLASFTDTRFYEYPAYWFGSAVLTAVCVAAILYVSFGKWKQRTDCQLKWLYMSFWFICCVGIFPYLVCDIRSIGQPLNCLLFCGLLVLGPVLTVKESMGLFVFYYLVNLAATLIYGAAGQIYLLITLIILCAFILSHATHQTYLKTIRRLEIETVTDALTGLYNRRGGIKKAEILLQNSTIHGELCAVLIVDIDFFKNYNDQYGHIQGDTALVEVARCIQEIAAPHKIVVRLGGEEFMVCLPVRDHAQALEYAKKIRKRVEDLCMSTARKDASEYLTVSVGLMVYEPKGNATPNVTDCLKKADEGLYLVKNNGRNGVGFLNKLYRNDPVHPRTGE